MRLILATIAFGVSTVPALAGELDGRWKIQNGNTVEFRGNSWTVVGYSFGSYTSNSGTISKIGPNQWYISGGDLRLPRTCTQSGNTLRCNWGTVIRKMR